jgi:hypothetical protein
LARGTGGPHVEGRYAERSIDIEFSKEPGTPAGQKMT